MTEEQAKRIATYLYIQILLLSVILGAVVVS
jgi:hypothetical protein